MTTKPSLYEWYTFLPPEIRGGAYISAGGEMAFSRPDAMRVASLLQEQGYGITSIETWLPSCPGPVPLIDDWDETNAIPALDFVETFDLENKYGRSRGLPVYFSVDA
jgi:hypothetical protein